VTSQRILVHTLVQPLRRGRMDALGHLDDVVRCRCVEQARVESLCALAAVSWPGHGAGPGTVDVNASCDFPRPLVHPGSVEVKTWLADSGRSSTGGCDELSNDRRAHAAGAAEIARIDLATGRPVQLPEAIRVPLRAAG
jgi:acyl-CoA thioester hydrolase